MIANRSTNLNLDPGSWQQYAHAEIMTVIKNKDQITYNALAATANMTGPHKIHRLTSWLEQLMAEDHDNDRPLRAAVVISKARGGLPAPGFFDKAKELGLDFETTDRHANYKAYLQTVYASISEL
tara:strand:- start:688 stop:1062 length:375 start_codon:yes stop_codon:yes gene_type:complete